MLSRKEIADKLKELLINADDSKADAINAATDESDLSVDLGLDSIRTLYMVIAIEESFDIRFKNVNMSDFKTFGDTVDFVEAKLKEK